MSEFVGWGCLCGQCTVGTVTEYSRISAVKQVFHVLTDGVPTVLVCEQPPAL